MHFLNEYGLFLAKLASTVIALLFLIAGIMALSGKNKKNHQKKLSIKKLNQKYLDIQKELYNFIADKTELKKLKQTIKKRDKKSHRNTPHTPTKRLFVLNFLGDMRAGEAHSLTESISAILLIARPDDQVLLRLESAGGLVNAYGLAASQLQRIKKAKLKLVVAIDKIAASGGYMMACVADEIVAAPFAVVGSIGVVTQLPNLHRYLKNKHIDFEQITAGEYKRTLTLLGKNTEEARKKVQQQVDDIHASFKNFITTHRRHVDINTVATGEYWFAEQTQQLNLNLVDTLQTSEDYLLSLRNDFDIFEINHTQKKTILNKLTQKASLLMSQLGVMDHLGWHNEQSGTRQDQPPTTPGGK